MELDLHDELERAIGHGPPLVPAEQRLVAGRRALRRRRAAAALAAVGIVAALGVGWSAAGSDPQHRSAPIAVDPSPTTPEASDWEDGTLVRYVDGELEIREGVVVHDRVDNPYGYAAPRKSVALDLTWQGQRHWLIGGVERDGNSFGYQSTVPGGESTDFRTYVAEQAYLMTGGKEGWPETLRLDDTGRVVPTRGTNVVDRTDDPRLGDSFAPAGTPTGAAVVTVAGDDVSYFVVWRVLDGRLDVITAPPADTVGATFEQLLTYARSQYSSGEGLR
ncbi:hypothetical protein ACFP3Q_08195 [Nocardioides sp. GCM10027113]|uniref:hypothetical protein n=1 Tax=unclassified Nocardioides TaxID=2615069 RepID=UPI00360F1EE0